MDAEAGAGRVSGYRAFFSEAEDGLIAYARHVFGLSQRANPKDAHDTATVRDHLETAARNRNPDVAANARRQLTAPAFPERYRYLWGWFMELQSHRGESMSGAARLTWPDVDAWARCMRHAPSPWEFRVLGRLDEAFLTIVRESV